MEIQSAYLTAHETNNEWEKEEKKQRDGGGDNINEH